MQDHSVEDLVLAFEEEWRHGPPRIERYRSRLAAEESCFGLAELVRADLRQRYRRGERPSAREYFDRFPELTGEDGHALTLIFEEFCLKDEAEELVDSAEFCARYESWRDRLVSQLVCHREFKNRAVEPLPTSPDFPEAGDRFCDYRLLEHLGTGASAQVFLAQDLNLGHRKVALKISRDRGAESAVLGKLDHDHIIKVFTTFVDPATGFRGISMQYQPSLPLNKVLGRFSRNAIPQSASALQEVVNREFPALPIEEGRRSGWADFPSDQSYANGVAWVGWKMAGALAHAHGQGIFHRDGKPDNILLTRRDGPQLLDFNLAHDSAADQAHAALRGGTLPYMAREQLQAFLDQSLWKDVGAPADVFSLGMILREMLTLRPPAKPPANFSDARAINDLIARRSAPLVPIRRLNPKVPHALEAIVVKCLAESPEDRYGSAHELADDLRCFLDRRALKVACNPSRIEIACNQARHRARLSGVVVAVILFVGLTFLVASLAHRASEARDHIHNAWKALEQGDNDQANELFDNAVKRPFAMWAFELESQDHKNSFSFAMSFAQALCRVNRFDEGEIVYRQAMVIDPFSSQAVHGCATAEMGQGKLNSALASINQAIKLCIDDATPKRRTEAIALRLTRAQIFLRIGDAAKDDRNFAKARDDFSQAIVDLGFIGANADVTAVTFLSPTYHYSYAVAKASLGDIAYHFRNFQIARDCYQTALDHVKAARKTSGEDAKLLKPIDDLEASIKEKERERIVP